MLSTYNTEYKSYKYLWLNLKIQISMLKATWYLSIKLVIRITNLRFSSFLKVSVTLGEFSNYHVRLSLFNKWYRDLSKLCELVLTVGWPDKFWIWYSFTGHRWFDAKLICLQMQEPPLQQAQQVAESWGRQEHDKVATNPDWKDQANAITSAAV